MTARRRFFWGQSLTQAVARAARHHGIPAEELRYRVHAKRHGFLKYRRTVLIEVELGAELQATDSTAAPPAPASPPPPPTAAQVTPAPRPPTPTATARPPATAAPADRARARERDGEAPTRAAAAERGADEEAWDSPDEEAALAASEATRKLLAFAGVAVEVVVRRTAERLEIELDGADRERLRGLGSEFLDALELLLPRAVLVLCGRRVRCRIEGAGLRVAREAELRALARAAAQRVRASGREEILSQLNPAERRIVHLELAGDATVATESLGQGVNKRLRVAPAGDRPRA